MSTIDQIRVWLGYADGQMLTVEDDRIMDEILESGSTDEADWVRIAGGNPDHVLDAAALVYARASQAADDAADVLRAAIRGAVTAGMSEVEAARRSGVSRPTVRAWLGK